MTLTSIGEVVKIYKKSTSKCFTDLQVGDIIGFSIPIQAVGIDNKGRTRSTYICCQNWRTKNESKLTFNQIERVLACCELKEYNPYYVDPNTQQIEIIADNEKYSIDNTLYDKERFLI